MICLHFGISVPLFTDLQMILKTPHSLISYFIFFYLVCSLQTLFMTRDFTVALTSNCNVQWSSS